jgi:hypothetical protein
VIFESRTLPLLTCHVICTSGGYSTLIRPMRSSRRSLPTRRCLHDYRVSVRPTWIVYPKKNDSGIRLDLKYIQSLKRAHDSTVMER